MTTTESVRPGTVRIEDDGTGRTVCQGERMGPVVLVTGASSGIGAAAVRSLLRRGRTVYAGARRVDRMAELARAGARLIALDVTDATSRTAAVDQVLEQSGRIDVLVNNAGYGSYGAVEEVPLAEARDQFEVNLFGLAGLVQLVLPTMRARRSGRIVNVSSMGGRIWEPLGAWYHASKFAVEGFSDSLRVELRPFGIDVVVVEPGSTRSEWGPIAADNVAARSGRGPYADQARMMEAVLRSTTTAPRRATDPDEIGELLATAATARRPRTRYVAGVGARPLLFLRWALPDRGFDRVITTTYRRLTG
jgi:NAD(P)-dependent dehydrogenase (short-subunit alcohol dehydrogenase family)